MAMYKAANVPEEVIFTIPVNEENDEVSFYPEEKSSGDGETVEMVLPATDPLELSFKNCLPFLPGAPDEMIKLDSDDELEVDSDEDKKEKEKDKSKSDDQLKDLNWVKDYLHKIPRHVGETLGLERSKSYLTRGLNHLSKMVQEDHDGHIDISKAEDARVEMENGIDRLEKELQKRKKKANKSPQLTKEGQKIAGVGGIIVTVPLIVSTIARVCINSTVSGGKDIEKTFERLASKYKLSDREKIEVVQLIADMGFQMRRDRGLMVNDDEPYGYSSENNTELPPNYQA